MYFLEVGKKLQGIFLKEFSNQFPSSTFSNGYSHFVMQETLKCVKESHTLEKLTKFSQFSWILFENRTSALKFYNPKI